MATATQVPSGSTAPSAPPKFLPGLYYASDAAAQVAQTRHLRVVKSELSLLALGAILALLSSQKFLPASASLFAALVLVVSIIVAYVGRSKRFERQWFDCRAIAESVKTMSWRYMMKAEPFVAQSQLAETDSAFVRELSALSRARPDVAGLVAEYGTGGEQITAEMRRVRQLPLDERRATYLERRLCYERDWYRQKAAWNSRQDSRWFLLAVGLQLLAAALAIAFVAQPPQMHFSPVPVLATVATAALAWSRTKRFVDLSQSYGLATQELSSLAALAVHQTEESSLDKWVQEVETAISREHTMWLARRTS